MQTFQTDKPQVEASKIVERGVQLLPLSESRPVVRSLPMTSPKNVAPVGELNRERILDAALRIADSDGLDALTMRRLAADLGTSPMATYRHIPGKPELLGLLAERFTESLPRLDTAKDWRGEISRYFTDFYHYLSEHPGVATVLVTRPIAGPQALKSGEEALRVFRSAGMSRLLAVQAFTALASYSIGAALYASSRATVAAAGQPAASRGLTELPADEYPTLHDVADQLLQQSGADLFRSGLAHLISGYALELAD